MKKPGQLINVGFHNWLLKIPQQNMSFWTLIEDSGRRKDSHMSDLSGRICLTFCNFDKTGRFGRCSKVRGGVKTHECRICQGASVIYFVNLIKMVVLNVV